MWRRSAGFLVVAWRARRRAAWFAWLLWQLMARRRGQDASTYDRLQRLLDVRYALMGCQKRSLGGGWAAITREIGLLVQHTCV